MSIFDTTNDVLIVDAFKNIFQNFKEVAVKYFCWMSYRSGQSRSICFTVNG